MSLKNRFPKDIVSIIDHLNHQYRYKQCKNEYNNQFSVVLGSGSFNCFSYLIKYSGLMQKMYNFRNLTTFLRCEEIRRPHTEYGYKNTGYLPKNY